MNRKKILSLAIVIVAVMGLSIIPITVFAEDGGVQDPIQQDPPEPYDPNDPDPDFSLSVSIWTTDNGHNYNQGDWINWEATITNDGPDEAPDVTGEFSLLQGWESDENGIIGIFPLSGDGGGASGGSDLGPGDSLYDYGTFQATMSIGMYTLKYTAYSEEVECGCDTWPIWIGLA